MAEPLDELLLPDAPAWRAWLAEHHADSPGVRLVLHKKGGDTTRLAYADAVEEALCFGWIDGQLGRRDAGSYTIRFTPRRPGSAWSARNVERVGRLRAAGRMAPAGEAAVAAARADGRWEAAYAGSATAQPPAEFLAALEANADARAAYGRLGGRGALQDLLPDRDGEARSHPGAARRRVRGAAGRRRPLSARRGPQ